MSFTTQLNAQIQYNAASSDPNSGLPHDIVNLTTALGTAFLSPEVLPIAAAGTVTPFPQMTFAAKVHFVMIQNVGTNDVVVNRPPTSNGSGGTGASSYVTLHSGGCIIQLGTDQTTAASANQETPALWTVTSTSGSSIKVACVWEP